MNIRYKNRIYDRLLEISVKFQVRDIPDPQYINEAITQCHFFIEEVEHYNIEISKEISLQQQALNNAIADYDYKKEKHLTQNEEIKNLPNIKDREAKANILLNDEIQNIKHYQNEVNDLNNLLKAVNLKLKNLNRCNSDIKMQLRVLEARLKLGSGPGSESAYKSLTEEFKKGLKNEDSFKENETKIIKEQIQDPSIPLDIDNLLDTDSDTDDTDSGIIDTDSDTDDTDSGIINTDSDTNDTDSGIIDTDSDTDDTDSGIIDTDSDTDDTDSGIIDTDSGINDIELNESADIPTDEDPWPDFDNFINSENPKKENEKNAEKSNNEKSINLDNILDFSNQKGGTKKQKAEEQITLDKVESIQKEGHNQKEGINIDDLLDNLNI